MSVKVCIRCKAKTKNGRGPRCKRSTCKYGPYCFQHTRSIEGVEIKKSKLPGAGLGLFATRDFKKKSKISSYGGEIISDAVHNQRDSGYAIVIGRGRTGKNLDGRATSSGNGRYVNSCRRQNRPRCNRNNVHLPQVSIRNGVAKGKLTATRAIKAGSEIYASYGPGYWKKAERKKKRRPKNARPIDDFPDAGLARRRANRRKRRQK